MKTWPQYEATFFEGVKNTLLSQNEAASDSEDGSKSDRTSLVSNMSSTDLSDPEAPACIRKTGSDTIYHTQWEFVRKYFKTEWFTSRWLGMSSKCLPSAVVGHHRSTYLTEHVTDIGLPPGQTRDGTWNTNNWTEIAFQVFDKVFLENRYNKR